MISVVRAGVCGSDVTAHKGKMGIARPGAIRGHEFAGIIAESTVPGLRPGERATINPVVSCGDCAACRCGSGSSCSDIEIIGVHRPGGFADMVAVPAAAVHVIPDELSWEAAASAEPLAQAIHDVRVAISLGPITRCLVIGSGTIGLWLIHALRLEGAQHIVVVDPDLSRHPQAFAAGAHACVSPEDVSPASFDAVFDVVGIESTRSNAVAAAKNGGTIIAVGMGSSDGSIPWFDLVRREITIRGANCFNPDDFSQALTWLIEGAVPPPHHRLIAVENGAAVFDELSASPSAFNGKTFFTF